MFEHILYWKLLPGSHEFPGPDGGTCINEAAIVAAGFKYRAISTSEDCPPCFSRVISAYAIGLNDRMPHDLRQKLLLPFVTRLAGTMETPEVEKARLDLIVMRTEREIGSITIDPVADSASAATYPASAATYAAHVAAADDPASAERIWTITVSILDEAIRLGRQTDLIETTLVAERMERAKALV